jgi:hypothetical protein
MRIVTIAIAGHLVTSGFRPDSYGGFQWIVQVTERNGIIGCSWSVAENAGAFRAAMRSTSPLGGPDRLRSISTPLLRSGGFKNSAVRNGECPNAMVRLPAGLVWPAQSRLRKVRRLQGCLRYETEVGSEDRRGDEDGNFLPIDASDLSGLLAWGAASVQFTRGATGRMK